MVPQKNDNIDSTKHSCECRCEICQKNQTGYFAQWREETLQLQVAPIMITLRLAYFRDEMTPRTCSFTPGTIEISLVPQSS